MTLDDIQKLARMGSRAAALKEDIIHKSIAATAQDSVFQFPTLVSDSTSVSMAAGITRLLDRTYASFVQIVISQVGNVDISKDPTPNLFMQKLHQNMRLESADDEEEERIIKENFYDGKLAIAVNETAGIAFAFEATNPSSKLYAMNINECRDFLSDFDVIPFMEAPNDDITRTDIINGIIQNKAGVTSRDRQKLAQSIGGNTPHAPSLIDKDVKKLNDLQPYAIQVRLNVINDNNEFVQYWDLVVGVKAVLHLVKSNEMVENISRAVRGNNATFNFIRWTTGEISFFKDLVLHIDDIKFDMASRSKGYSQWFPALKRLKNKKVGFRNFRVNQLVPNATIVITSYECDELERQGVMIRDVAIARKVINDLFLMAFVIVDEGSQTLDILYQDGSSFETIALETIQREISTNSNRIGNELGRLLTQR